MQCVLVYVLCILSAYAVKSRLTSPHVMVLRLRPLAQLCCCADTLALKESNKIISHCAASPCVGARALSALLQSRPVASGRTGALTQN